MSSRDIIKMFRRSMGFSQNKFSEYTGIPVANIQKWEQGVTSPPDYVVYLIARVMLSDEIVPARAKANIARVIPPNFRRTVFHGNTAMPEEI